jgi:hypothetical protein
MSKRTRSNQKETSRKVHRAVADLARDMMRKDPNLGKAAATRRARQIVIARNRENPHRLRMRQQTEPRLKAVRRSEVCSLAEQRAIRDNTLINWLFLYLLAAGRTKPFMNRCLAVAALFQMAYFSRPQFSYMFARFRANDSMAWAHYYPKGPFSIDANYKALRKITDSGKAGAAIHVNLDLLDKIAAVEDSQTGARRFSNALRFCSVDGTLIEANVPQNLPRVRTPRERKALIRKVAGPLRLMADSVYHGFGKNSGPMERPEPEMKVRKSCFGYNLVVISCLDTCLPIIWTLIPATGDEVTATRELLDALYQLRPDFPMEYLVGDGLYSGGFEFPASLYYSYGVHLVTPRTNRTSASPWAASDGVPCCDHGLMDFKRHGEVWDAPKRREHGIKPGNLPPKGLGQKPRLRFECPEKECPPKSTRMSDNWILHTYLPHVGSNKWTALREILLARRNTSESLFAQLKHLGVGARWPNRARWATDNGMRWLTSLALLSMTARKLVHVDGSYSTALGQVYEAGFITQRELWHYRDVEGIEPESVTPSEGFDVPPPTWEGAPSTWEKHIELPIDQPYTPLPPEAFSDIPYDSEE